MTKLYIDGRAYTAETHGRNLLEVCLSLGLNVPYFCWHPVFRSIGACRQCAVKVFRDEQDTRGRIEMACMISAHEGMRIAIDDPEAVAFRRKVIEWLMINHPHDCPVCDEGGECHLQDMTVMTGHVYRQYRFSKRTFRNQHLGPFVNMEMSRCIQCYRCVRFYRDYAGGRDFDVLGWHDEIYFGRHEDGALESAFSGNLVEVCPTGVFTDKSLKPHDTRKWDLQTAPSICPHCGLGCNTLPGERYGLLRRIMPRYNGQVNGGFICDRGRYGYAFVNAAGRIRQARWRGGAGQAGRSREQVRLKLGELLRAGGVLGVGSPRASLESNFALRTLVGPANFYHGQTAANLRLTRLMRDRLIQGPARTPSLREVEACDAVLVLGEDVSNTAPLLELALRQAVRQQPRAAAVKLGIPPWLDASLRDAMQDQMGPLFVATPDRTNLDDLAAAVFHAAPEDIARLGWAVAHAIDPSAAAVSDLDPVTLALAGRIAAALKTAAHPLVVSGAGCRSETVVAAAAAVAASLCQAGVPGQLAFATPECNSMGAAMLPGEGLETVQERVRSGAVKTMIVLENDLFRTLDPDCATRLLKGVEHVVVLDHRDSPTTDAAEIVLPAATVVESSGTFVNNEGRAQRFFQVFVPPGDIQAAWRWIGELLTVNSRPSDGTAPAPNGDAPPQRWASLDDLVREMAVELPVFAAIPDLAPAAGFRMVDGRIPRQPARCSGRTAITAHLDVHEPKPPDDPDSPLSFSMEGSLLEPPAALLPRYWAPQWNSVQALNKFQTEVGGPLHGGDPGRRLFEPPDYASGWPGRFAPGQSAGGASVSETRPCAERPGHLFETILPPAFEPRLDMWRLLPAWHIYGSDELSVLSPGVSELSAKPYLALNQQDMQRLGVQPNEVVAVAISGRCVRLPVISRPALATGVALVPAGLPGCPFPDLPAWARIASGGRA